MKLDTKTCVRAGLTVFIVFLAIHFWPAVSSFLLVIGGALMPLLVGLILAYLTAIPMHFYEKHWFPNAKSPRVQKTRKPLCIVLAILSVLLVIGLVFALILPELVSCFRIFADLIPGALDTVFDWLAEQEWLPATISETLNAIDWNSKMEEIAKSLFSGLGSAVTVVTGAVTSVFSGVVTFFIGAIFAIYLLFGENTLRTQLTRLMTHYLPQKIYSRIFYIGSVFNESFHKFIVGQCIEAIILGVLCTIGMLILRLPYASMIGALIAFTALIPIAGAWIGAGVGAFMIATQSPVKALIFLIFLVLLQQFETNLIYPRVVGSSIGLPGLFVLAAVTVGGSLGGISGMLLGVPMTAAVYKIVREDMRKRDAKSAAPAGIAAPADGVPDGAVPETASAPAEDTPAPAAKATPCKPSASAKKKPSGKKK